MREQLQVAYVDDDPVLRDTMSAMFRRLVDSIEVFARPQEVIDRFRVDNRPNILFTDGQMPEMTGLELARAIREQHPATTIVLVSTGIYGVNLDDPDELGRHGIDLFIRKRDFVPSDALERVRGLRAQQGV